MKLVHRKVLVAAASVVSIAAGVATTSCNRNPFEPDRSGVAGRSYDDNDKSGAGDSSGAERVGKTTTTGADYTSLSSNMAVERIVAARCARETQCNNIGDGKHFSNHEGCASELRGKVGDDLKPSECPAGVDSKAIDKCLDTIRTESCNNPIDTVARLAACRSGELCVKETR
jgi:hypothetical protein